MCAAAFAQLFYLWLLKYFYFQGQFPSDFCAGAPIENKLIYQKFKKKLNSKQIIFILIHSSFWFYCRRIPIDFFPIRKLTRAFVVKQTAIKTLNFCTWTSFLLAKRPTINILNCGHCFFKYRALHEQTRQFWEL